MSTRKLESFLIKLPLNRKIKLELYVLFPHWEDEKRRKSRVDDLHLHENLLTFPQIWPAGPIGSIFSEKKNQFFFYFLQFPVNLFSRNVTMWGERCVRCVSWEDLGKTGATFWFLDGQRIDSTLTLRLLLLLLECIFCAAWGYNFTLSW